MELRRLVMTTSTGADTTALSFDERISRLAEVAVRIGLGLQNGQELVMTAPLEAAPLARAITTEAYKAGASLVTTFYSDDAATLARFAHAPEDAFDTAAGWLYSGMADAFRNGAARLAIAGDDPSLLAGQDAQKVARRQSLALEGLCAGSRTHREFRHELDDRFSGDPPLGTDCIPGLRRGRSPLTPVERDLCGVSR